MTNEQDPYAGTYYRMMTTAIDAAESAKFYGDPDSIALDLITAERKIIIAIAALREAQQNIADRLSF